jgi:pantetheine-phosphate adenylyltransferase
MTRVLYPGSFDPITKGHMNIIYQASILFDEVIISIQQNEKKTPIFSLEERLDMISELYKSNNNIKVVIGEKATVDTAMLYECKAIVRGLRTITDFDNEIMMQQINKDISNNQINTICLFADREYQFISSSIIKELFNLNKDIKNYTDPLIERKLIMKRGN